MTDRRLFLTGLFLTGPTIALLAPRHAAAQEPGRVKKIGMLYGYPKEDAEGQRFDAAFRQKLESLGWIEPRNVRLEARWAGGEAARLGTLARELVESKPDAILTHSTQLIAALQRETRNVPIVFAGASDPVESGLVASLARPGGNVTGFATVQFAGNGKMLEFLKEIAPGLTRVAVIMNSSNPSQAGRLGGIDSVGRSLGIEVRPLDLKDPAEIGGAITGFASTPGSGLIVLPGAFAGTHRGLIIDAAAKARMPAMYPRDFYVRDGGLISYSASQTEQFRQAATYIDRILKGEKPADLPVHTPTKFELTINLRTAKALDIDPPISILARADEVIE